MTNTGSAMLTGTSGSRGSMDGLKLEKLSLPELIELLHRIADEILLREMEQAE